MTKCNGHPTEHVQPMQSAHSQPIMTISASDSSGTTGVQRDLLTISRLGGHGVSVVTAVIAQNSRETAAIAEVPEEVVIAQIDSVAEDFAPVAVKTGMLGGRRVIANVVDRLEAWGMQHVVVHPSMTSPFGVPVISPEGLTVVRDELLPMATLLFLGRTDAEALAERSLDSRQEIENAASQLRNLGAGAIAVSDAGTESEPSLLICEDGCCDWIPMPVGSLASSHSVNDTVSAAITVFLAQGLTLHAAAEAALDYLRAEMQSLQMVPSDTQG